MSLTIYDRSCPGTEKTYFENDAGGDVTGLLRTCLLIQKGAIRFDMDPYEQAQTFMYEGTCQGGLVCNTRRS